MVGSWDIKGIEDGFVAELIISYHGLLTSDMFYVFFDSRLPSNVFYIPWVGVDGRKPGTAFWGRK